MPMVVRIQHGLWDEKDLGDPSTFPTTLNLRVLICKREMISALWDLHDLVTSY